MSDAILFFVKVSKR